ncbi:MerC domain-containing protein [Alteromonas sp. C1M14]|uniref:MerC domain-containing protein n=1 Tax=Alteromonas sp. C1M14 TaxID=2841567 RepID=UPI001C0810F1|nr:MerC domain-containing protein [Alteromonas sp. C1M14]MBU2976874.1 MerC domain-containing protein [Alteromonas sp. C1M14]
MTKTQALTDKLSIGLSVACTIHCLALPLLMTIVPAMAALGLDDERFHFWMIIAVIPCSVLALAHGCRQHKKYPLIAVVATGLTLLVLALFAGERFGEVAEKMLTVTGALFVATGHGLNYWYCRKSKKDNCECN